MIRLLITGASGFIGRHVLEELSSAGYSILAPMRRPMEFPDRNLYKNVIFLEGKFYSDTLLREYENFNPDMIIHLAAIRGEGRGRWKDYYEVNVLGTKKLVEFALTSQVSRFLYCSTVGIFGTTPSRLPADPWTSANPEGYYHISKYQAEKTIIQQLRGKIPHILFRPTITYGEGDNGFIPRLVKLVRSHMFPLISRDILIHLVSIKTIREFVRKAVQKEALEQDYIVNLADKEPVYLTDLVDLIHKYFTGKPYPRILKISPFLFNLGIQLSKLLKQTSLQISLQLVSQPWYYDTSHLENLCDCTLKDSLKEVHELLKKMYPSHAAKSS